MKYSDDFIAGWTAAREAAQLKGSVPPLPPGHEPTEPAAEKKPKAKKKKEPVVEPAAETPTDEGGDD